jgi:hypothetical protein
MKTRNSLCFFVLCFPISHQLANPSAHQAIRS